MISFVYSERTQGGFRTSGAKALSLSGGAGTTVFRIAFDQWIGTNDSRPLTEHIEEVLDQFSAIAKTQR